MREGEQSDTIYVGVDSSKIVRCGWCGIMEGGGWLHTRGRFYCSVACSFADSAQHVTPGLLCVSVIGPILVMLVFPVYVGRWEFWAIAMTIVMIELPLLYSVRKWMVHRWLVPRNSRENKISLDTALLGTLSTSVVCPRCDAEIDLQSIGKDRTYVCGHCGATGAIAVVDKSGQRGSSSGRSI